MDIKNRSWSEYTAYNGRFHASGGVRPQKRRCLIASYYPAETVVNPRLREAAGTLWAMQGKTVQKYIE